MREFVGVNVLANLVSMLRADLDGAIVLVDQDREAGFYRRCIHEDARVVPCESLAREVFEQIKSRGVQGVIACVRGDSVGHFSEGIFLPSVGDVASLFLISDCSKRVLGDLGGYGWTKAAEKELGCVIKSTISLSATLEKLSCVVRRKPDENFITEFVNWSNLSLNSEKIKINFGDATHELIFSLYQKIVQKDNSSILKLFDGHTALEFLHVTLNKYRPKGITAEKAAEVDDIFRMMKLVYDLEEFENDLIFWEMKSWERRTNFLFPLLGKWRDLDSLEVILNQKYWSRDLKMMRKFDQEGGGLSAYKIDLDNFKAVNEYLGHGGGDEAIKLACRTLHDVAKSVAEVYRRGGDELVALAPGLRGEGAAKFAENLRFRFESEFAAWCESRGLSFSVTASIGVVDAGPMSSAEDIEKLMDAAQISAKVGGKNRVEILECA